MYVKKMYIHNNAMECRKKPPNTHAYISLV